MKKALHFAAHTGMFSVEFASASVVILVDMLGMFTEHYHTLGVVHEFAATGFFAVLASHAVKKHLKKEVSA